MKRKPPSQEELTGIDALLVAPNTLDTAVFRAVDTEWPVVVFDQIDRTFPTDSSKLFGAASTLRTRRRIGCLSSKEALNRAPKMRALLGLVYPGAEGDPLQYVAPFSHDPATGGHLILPSAQYARPARGSGSKSAAVRDLMAAYEMDSRARALEEGYREYFRDPAAARRDLELTEEMLSISSWPTKEPHARKRGDKPGTAARRGVSRRPGGSRRVAPQEASGADRSERRR